MRERLIKFKSVLWELLLGILEGKKNRYRAWYAKTYRQEQEHTLKLASITNREIKWLWSYVHWSTDVQTMSLLVLITIGVVAYALVAFAIGDMGQHEFLFILGACVIIFGPMALCLPDNIKQTLAKTTEVVWDNPKVSEARRRYRYFFINGREEIVFTNTKPFVTLCAHPRMRTDVEWPEYQPNRVRAFLDWLLMSTIYLRFIWPFVLSPMQLAFLAYWSAMKKVSFEPGMNVLMIGSGPLPYHSWWKGKLGPTGHITALDIDPYVNNTSHQVETAFEWLRGLFFQPRWVSTHVVGDAEELPFDDGQFDIVVAIRCYHVNMAEGVRVLKPGGKLLVDDTSQIAKLDRETQQVDESSSWWILTA